MTVLDSTVSGNSTPAANGGITNGAGAGQLTIRHTTVTGNTAHQAAGVHSGGGPMTIENSTISGNTATAGGSSLQASSGAPVSLRSTILASNGPANCFGAETITSLGFNLASDASCGLDVASDQSSADPKLGPLTDNGGPTATMAPAEDSPVLDNGFAGAIVLDQRGEARPVDLPELSNLPGGGGADIGAVELQPSEFAVPAVSVTGGPQGTTSERLPIFSFNVEDAVEVRCSIDTGTPAFEPCATETTHTPAEPLPGGDWTFRVRGRNAAGVEVVATRGFAVDFSGPTVEITDGPGPGATIATDSASFAFVADSPGSTFECRLDDGAFQPCLSPASYAGLTDGPHGFRVRATDAVGNTGPGEGRVFSVQTARPPTDCTAAQATLDEAERALGEAAAKRKKAKRTLKKAKASLSEAKIKKAKKALKKAKTALEMADEDRGTAEAALAACRAG